jgi:hypothetical protein
MHEKILTGKVNPKYCRQFVSFRRGIYCMGPQVDCALSAEIFTTPLLLDFVKHFAALLKIPA